MTKEETKQAIAVMQAYCEGKSIQFKGKKDIEWSNSDREGTFAWNWNVYDYRIKPEAKVRPYTFEEMCEAVKKHGLLVKTKGINEVFAVGGFDEENVFYKEDCCETYEEFVKHNTWLDDNSPCGVVEEE